MREINKNLYSDFRKEANIYADDVNLIFPIDTEENITASLSVILEDKEYSKAEQLYMLNRLVEKSRQFGNDFLLKIRESAKGGNVVAEKLTPEEIAKASEEAVEKVLSNKEEKNKAKATVNELENMKEQLKSLTDAMEAAKAEKEQLEKDKQEAEDKLKQIEVEASEKALADKRIAELDYSFGESQDFVFEYLKKAEDETFANFKKMLEDVIASEKTKEAEAASKEDEDKEDKEKAEAKKNLADNSEEIPNNSDEKEPFASIDKIFEKK